MARVLLFVYLFAVLAVLLPAAGFFDLYLLPWQSRLIFVDNPNLWRAMRDNPAAYLPFTHLSALPYGPLFYYPTGLWVYVLDRLHLLDLHAWSDFGIATASIRYTALLKLPNLAVYLATAAVLRRSLPGRAGPDAMLLWLFNPAVILAAFVMGQNDGWSILAVLLAFLLAARVFDGRAHLQAAGHRLPVAPLAMAALGAGAAIKLHPLLFVPTFAYLLGGSWRERVLLAAVAAAAFGLLIAPFVSDSFFREHALFSPQGENIFRYGLGPLPLFYPGYALALLLPLAGGTRGLRPLLTTLVAVHLLVFALSDWPPERAAWFIGVLALAAALSRAGLLAYLLTTVQVFIVAMELGNGLGAGAFALLSDRLSQQPGLNQALNRAWNYDHVQTIGLWLAVAGWILALGFLLWPKFTLRPRSVPLWVPAAVLSLLPAWFAGSLLYGSGGLTGGPPGPRTGILAGPGIMEQSFVAGAQSFSAVDLAFVASGQAPPTVMLLGEDGQPAEQATPGPPEGDYRRFSFAPIADSQRRVYHLRLEVPDGTSIFLAQAPAGGYVAEATIDGRPAGGALDFRQHYSRAWRAIGSDAREQVAAGWRTIASVGGLLLAAMAALWWYAWRPRTPAAEGDQAPTTVPPLAAFPARDR